MQFNNDKLVNLPLSDGTKIAIYDEDNPEKFLEDLFS